MISISWDNKAFCSQRPRKWTCTTKKGRARVGLAWVAHHKSAPASAPRGICSLVFDRLWKSCGRSAASPDTNEKDKRRRSDGHVSVRAGIQADEDQDRSHGPGPAACCYPRAAPACGGSRKQTFPQSAACVRHLRPGWDSLMASAQAVKSWELLFFLFFSLQFLAG